MERILSSKTPADEKKAPLKYVLSFLFEFFLSNLVFLDIHECTGLFLVKYESENTYK